MIETEYRLPLKGKKLHYTDFLVEGKKVVATVCYNTRAYPRQRTATTDNKAISTREEAEFAVKEVTDFLKMERALKPILAIGSHDGATEEEIQGWIKDESVEFMAKQFGTDDKDLVAAVMEYSTFRNREKVERNRKRRRDGKR
jgi:hypothetical protein